MKPQQQAKHLINLFLEITQDHNTAIECAILATQLQQSSTAKKFWYDTESHLKEQKKLSV